MSGESAAGISRVEGRKKKQLLGRIGDLELQKDTLEEGERQSQVQKAELKE